MVQDTPSRKLDQYIVRFPDGMRDRLKAAAAANKRSLNAEIIRRLEGTLERDDEDQDRIDFERSMAGRDIEISPLEAAIRAAHERSQKVFDQELRALGFVSFGDPDAIERLEALEKSKAKQNKDPE